MTTPLYLTTSSTLSPTNTKTTTTAQSHHLYISTWLKVWDTNDLNVSYRKDMIVHILKLLDNKSTAVTLTINKTNFPSISNLAILLTETQSQLMSSRITSHLTLLNIIYYNVDTITNADMYTKHLIYLEVKLLRVLGCGCECLGVVVRVFRVGVMEFVLFQAKKREVEDEDEEEVDDDDDDDEFTSEDIQKTITQTSKIITQTVSMLTLIANTKGRETCESLINLNVIDCLVSLICEGFSDTDTNTNDNDEHQTTLLIKFRQFTITIIKNLPPRTIINTIVPQLSSLLKTPDNVVANRFGIGVIIGVLESDCIGQFNEDLRMSFLIYIKKLLQLVIRNSSASVTSLVMRQEILDLLNVFCKPTTTTTTTTTTHSENPGLEVLSINLCYVISSDVHCIVDVIHDLIMPLKSNKNVNVNVRLVDCLIQNGIILSLLNVIVNQVHTDKMYIKTTLLLSQVAQMRKECVRGYFSEQTFERLAGIFDSEDKSRVKNFIKLLFEDNDAVVSIRSKLMQEGDDDGDDYSDSDGDVEDRVDDDDELSSKSKEYKIDFGGRDQPEVNDEMMITPSRPTITKPSSHNSNKTKEKGRTIINTKMKIKINTPETETNVHNDRETHPTRPRSRPRPRPATTGSSTAMWESSTKGSNRKRNVKTSTTSSILRVNNNNNKEDDKPRPNTHEVKNKKNIDNDDHVSGMQGLSLTAFKLGLGDVEFEFGEKYGVAKLP